jgi:two-component system nitrogen regulation sensor histidine kinase NtrY
MPTHPKMRAKMTSRAKSHSLERVLKITLGLVFVTISTLLVLLLGAYSISTLLTITIIVALWGVFIPALFYFYRRVFDPLMSMGNSLEALRTEDHSVITRAHYQQGVFARLYHEVATLNADLQHTKDRYTQDVYLIYGLIEQLDTPVLVFNAKLKLTHANSAFNRWYGQPWQTVRGYSSKRLGLGLNAAGQWHFVDPAPSQQNTLDNNWQIKASVFVDGQDDYQLLMLNNIEQEVRETQQEAWQQIIRVLSHEIRNSLTPIKSLTQSLLDMDEIGTRPKQALQVIHDRSDSLQAFVNRYATMTKTFAISKTIFSANVMTSNIRELLSDIPMNIELPTENEKDGLQITADQPLLEQVLINLIKNAADSLKQQARASQQNNTPQDEMPPVSISFKQTAQGLLITIKDRGTGISNPDNLFVPFYTTKADGQGIGLFFCRKIIEKHGGRLSLKNRLSGGAKAVIQLPV